MMVAICEKSALFREALASAVTSRGHHVVCCVSALADAVGAIERSNPDVVLLDASLSDDDSLARLGASRENGLPPRVILLTKSAEDRTATAALEAGLADGVLDDAVALETLARAVDGGPTSRSRPRRTVAPPRRTGSVLTSRELEVIDLLLVGRSTDAIAGALGVTRSTVHSHVQSILRKFGAQSRTEAVSIYLGETTPHLGSVLWL
jgi:two-component system nitrate/nitrite response regulator NarL